MALTRVTAKKLAANRANALKSTGPLTAEGKARVSRNACKHYLYARKHTIPPHWQAHCASVAATAADDATSEPTLRALIFNLSFLLLWSCELDDFGDRILVQTIADYGGDFKRGAHAYLTKEPMSVAVYRRAMYLHRRIQRAFKSLERYQCVLERRRNVDRLLPAHAAAPPAPPQVMTAAAGAQNSPAWPIKATSDTKQTPVFAPCATLRAQPVAGLSEALPQQFRALRAKPRLPDVDPLHCVR